MLFKRTHRKLLPQGATITRTRKGYAAKWTDSKGRHTAPVTEDGAHVVIEAATWTARYRNASGKVIQRPTGCERLELAQAMLSEWQTLEEKRRAGVMTASEATAATWAHVDIDQHVTDYETHLRAHGRTEAYIKKTAGVLRKTFKALGVQSIQGLDRAKAERWLLGKEKISARSHNLYATALVCFGNWLVRQGRASVNAYEGITKKNERLDRRHVRRVLTDQEITALLEAARMRPVTERMTKNTSPETIAARRWLGETRAMSYEVMLSTGLRYSELKSILIGDCHLTDRIPHVTSRQSTKRTARAHRFP